MSYVMTLDAAVSATASLTSYIFEFTHYLQTIRLETAGGLFDPTAAYYEAELRMLREWLNSWDKEWTGENSQVHRIFLPDRRTAGEDWRPPIYKMALDFLPGRALSQRNPKYTIHLPAGGTIRKRGPVQLESDGTRSRRPPGSATPR